mmetsp:Transcript_79756/g.221998  ORF Transcript_79756/g.221998 Transcript_79756/m.221998 type:complete len:222 (+) Transcript_79756:103-768(+)
MVPGPPPRSGSFQYTEGTTLRVTGLKPDVRNTDLQPHFGEFGHVLRIHVLQGKGCAFVEYKDKDDSAEALKALDGTVILESTVSIAVAEPPPDRRMKSREEQDPHLRPFREPQGAPYGGMTRDPPERLRQIRPPPCAQGDQGRSRSDGRRDRSDGRRDRDASRRKGHRQGRSRSRRRRRSRHRSPSGHGARNGSRTRRRDDRGGRSDSRRRSGHRRHRSSR